MKHCIYKHTFPDGKVYIGQTRSGETEHRWRNGFGYKTQRKMYNAIKKFGWDTVKSEILEDNIPDELVDEREIHYINKYDSVRNGYNSSLGGSCYKGRKNYIHKESAIVMSVLKMLDYKDLRDYAIRGLKQGNEEDFYISDATYENINWAFQIVDEEAWIPVKHKSIANRHKGDKGQIKITILMNQFAKVGIRIWQDMLDWDAGFLTHEESERDINTALSKFRNLLIMYV